MIRAPLGRGPASRSDDVTLPEPPRGFCLGFDPAEGQMVVAWHCRLIPVFWAAIFCDPSCNNDATGPVWEAVRHWRVLHSWSQMGVAIKEIVRRPWLFPAFARRRFTRLRRHQQQTFRAIANDRFGRRTKPTAALKMPSDTAHGAEEASLRCSTTDHRNVIGK